MGQNRPIEELKAQINLVAVVEASGVKLNGTPPNRKGLCPLHPEKNASLVVHEDRQMFKCFGCGKGGDVLTWLQEHEGLSFTEALDLLQNLVGVVPQPPSPAPARPTMPEGVNRSEVLERIVERYHERLLDSRPAQDYLKSRGLDNIELWKAFRIGFCDGSLKSAFPTEGAVRQALEAVGVLNAKGKEHFLNCIVVPLTHPDRGVVNLYGRRITQNPTIPHCYLPGPLQGVLNEAALKTATRITLAESPLDALSLWSVGERNVTTVFSAKSMPVDLDELLTRYRIREVCFCLDGDDAGRSGTTRLAESMAHRGMRCSQVELPDGLDPNAVLVRHGADALRGHLSNAVPLFDTEPEPLTVERTGEFFLLRADGVTYQATARPPFSQGARVSLRVVAGGRTLVNTVNLHAQRSRQGMENQVVGCSGLPREVVGRHFLALLDALELYIQELKNPDLRPESAGVPSRKKPEQTPEQIAEGTALLQDPMLIERLLRDTEDLGYVGEDNNKLLVVMVGLSCKLDKPLSAIIRSQSAAGKSTLTDLVEKVCPAEDICYYSRLSPQALSWLPSDHLKRATLILEEREGSVEADYSIRALQSKARYKVAVVQKNPQTGQMETTEKEVEGPIAYIETTTRGDLNPENESRCLEITLDESEAQTRRIQEHQRRMRSFEGLLLRREHDAICERWQNAFRLLQPVSIVIPYQHLLSFPSLWPRTRRDQERFLSLIEMIAFLHQMQRPRQVLPADGRHPETVVVSATVADYRLAFKLAQDVLRVTLHELSRHGQELWSAIRRMTASLCRGRQTPMDVTFTRRELREHTRWPDRKLRETLTELVNMEYLVASGSQGKTFQYHMGVDTEALSDIGSLTLPDELAKVWQDPIPE